MTADIAAALMLPCALRDIRTACYLAHNHRPIIIIIIIIIIMKVLRRQPISAQQHSLRNSFYCSINLPTI